MTKKDRDLVNDNKEANKVYLAELRNTLLFMSDEIKDILNSPEFAKVTMSSKSVAGMGSIHGMAFAAQVSLMQACMMIEGLTIFEETDDDDLVNKSVYCN